MLDRLGRVAEAREAYVRARDEDVCPLRAVSRVREIVLAAGRDRDVPVVDFDALVAAQSKDGIPGRGLFLDHVHPTIDGNRLLARAIVDELGRRNLVRVGPGWTDAAIREARERVLGRLDPDSHARARKNLAKVLGWAGKFEEAGGPRGASRRRPPERRRGSLPSRRDA